MTELGIRLKETRLANGLSLEDLQSITKIQKRYLVGIEEGNYSAMPGNFYVRAFIKQYAEAVNLDPDEIFETYKSEIPSTYNEQLPDQLSRVKSHKTISDRNPKIFDVLPKILIGVFIIGAAALIYYFYAQNAGSNLKESINKENDHVKYTKSDNLEKVEASEKSNKKKEDTKKTNKNSNTKITDTTQKEEPTQEISFVQKSGTKSTFELKNTDKFVVKLVSNGQTWVNIKNGKGYSFYQGMLKKDETNSQTVDLTKESEAVLVIGRTVDTDIFVNDQKLEYAIPPTEEVRQDITIRFVR